MNEPVRLRETGGAARALLSAGKLRVPNASRQRALAFTGVAASVVTTGTAAAAGATSLAKSVVVCVCLGTLGGGVASLVVSETVARWQAPRVEARSAPAATTQKRAVPVATPPSVAAAPASDVAPEAAPASVQVAPTEHPGSPARPATLAPASAPAAALAPVASAPLSTNSSKPRASNLFDEQRIIESVRAAVSRGDAQSALATLDGYAQTYAQGQFGPEALALRIEALSAKGDLTRARNLAGEFRQRYPHHPLLGSVQTAVQGASGKR